ncbi:MAG: adenylosuccinate synthase [Candidatus Undinarchaeales archaeon]|nr:adenylosuccinate synthase [Candidatus Undinarchaeales archaeon]MDP7492044.1 adenylosuccinate synthase [Candidatus Undinarchaeales archaeon]
MVSPNDRSQSGKVVIPIPVLSIVGSQWGDEGKGKIVDAVSENADMIVRYQGGDNAGHTVMVEDRTYKFHVLPAGVLRGIRSLVASEVVVNPAQVKRELDALEREANLGIDPRCHVIIPYHVAMDLAKEAHRAKTTGAAIGTTARGIGPCYSDAADRTGITFFEFVGDPKVLEKRIRDNFILKEKYLRAVYDEGMTVIREGKRVETTADEIVAEYIELGKLLRPYLTDVSIEVNDAIAAGKNVVFEGAQGTLLDLYFGNYPKVTSSHPMTGAAFTSVGMPPMAIQSIGIMKAYVTKVGSGPVVTCLDGGRWPVDESASEPDAIEIRKQGKEYGATTGRARRVGWLDLVVQRYSNRINGFTDMALTKLDVLAGMDTIKICVAYECDGETITDYPSWDLEKLARCEPVYKDFPGFQKVEDENAQQIIAFIESEMGVPITILSTGPGRTETVYRGFEGLSGQ